MKSIKIFEKQLIRQNLILTLVILLIIICIIFSIFIKQSNIIENYFPFILIVLLFVYVPGISTMIKINQLNNDQLLKKELENIILYCQNAYILTENYIIPNFSKKKIIKYSDIILMYTKKHKTRNGLDEYLHLILDNGRHEKFLINTTTICIGVNAEPYDFSKIIIEKNKNILIGYTEYNRNIVFQKYGIQI